MMHYGYIQPTQQRLNHTLTDARGKAQWRGYEEPTFKKLFFQSALKKGAFFPQASGVILSSSLYTLTF